MKTDNKLEDQFYIGNGKKLFDITKLINKSNLDNSEKEMIIEEYNKISLANQSMRFKLNKIIESVNNVIKNPF